MNFYLSLSIVFPLFVYMSIGYIFKKTKYLDSHTTTKINKIIFNYFLPVLIAKNVYLSGEVFRSGKASNTVLFITFDILSQLVLLSLIIPRFIKDKKRLGAFIQVCFRGNIAIFAIPIGTALLGADGISVISLSYAIVVPIFNIFCVVVLEVLKGGKLKLSSLILSILKNPSIIGCIIGLLMIVFNISIPKLLDTPISAIISLTTPLALIMLGAELNFGHIKKDLKDLLFACLIKLIIWPGMYHLIAKQIGFSGNDLISIFVVNCVPTAFASYTLAAMMDSDDVFSSEAVAMTSVLSIFTVFIWILVLKFV